MEVDELLRVEVIGLPKRRDVGLRMAPPNRLGVRTGTGWLSDLEAELEARCAW